MKALTVRQPHAQLIALGVKTIETRTKPTKYRGPLLIHAGKAVPNYEGLPLGISSTFKLNGSEDASCLWLHGDRNRTIPLPLPLGAIVASCKLVDCVPVVRHEVVPEKPGYYIEDYVNPGDGQHRLWVLKLRSDGSIDTIDKVERQRPYGDFTPGRFAWLLEDIKPVEQRCPACWGGQIHWTTNAHMAPPYETNQATMRCVICNGKRKCDPIPAKSKQGLWEWAP